MKGFHCKFFYMMHSILGLVKEAGMHSMLGLVKEDNI